MTFEVVAVIAVILLAFLVGAAIPVLVQLSRTLRKTQEFIDSAGGRLEQTLDEVNAAARRLNSVGGTLEDVGGRVRSFLETTGALGEVLTELSNPVRSLSRVVKALGPAFVAGMRSMFASGANPEKESRNRYTEGPASERSAVLEDRGGTAQDPLRKEAQHGE